MENNVILLDFDVAALQAEKEKAIAALKAISNILEKAVVKKEA